ncbi:coenzyme F420-0:L-glutamate ligase [Halioglobus maricola]|uniref:Coenzyme F420-0:L-glutamate ligase n=1 Tax=Halioglobus maricola TaxID=2601894 RepID=A0A5P9NL14_9GAMM|nr:coenzyme F420-0:L-glutamate ligase [Halioglobus maricola]QFU76530.1 coenzyme F420-0:L-glutamate ligase [Halioglobus maricola]
MTGSLQLTALADFPRVEPGDDLSALLASSLEHNGIRLQRGDVLVLAQKIVSKAENCYVRLADVTPSPEALDLAERAAKDPRQAELILRESNEVVRVRPGVVIVEHRNGYVHANAGIDKSNIETTPEDPRVLLLPQDPDASATKLRDSLAVSCGTAPQIIINDSAGRAWRNGTVGIAIGTAGFDPLFNQIGEQDMFGNVLEVTEAAVADELAAAASLLMGQAAEACPVVHVRGANLRPAETGSRSLLRDKHMDMFR